MKAPAKLGYILHIPIKNVNFNKCSRTMINTLHLVIYAVTMVMNCEIYDHFIISDVVYFSSKLKEVLDPLTTAIWL